MRVAKLTVALTAAVLTVAGRAGADPIPNGANDSLVAMPSVVVQTLQEPLGDGTSGQPNVIPAAYLAGRSDALPPQIVAGWLNEPGKLFDASASSSVVQYIQYLVGSDNRTVSPLVRLAEGSVTPLQLYQLARGMANARKASEVPAPEYAIYIDETVAASTSVKFVDAYEAALAEEETAAINAPGRGRSPDGPGSLSGLTSLESGDGGDETVVTQSGSFDFDVFSSFTGGQTNSDNDGSPAE